MVRVTLVFFYIRVKSPPPFDTAFTQLYYDLNTINMPTWQNSELPVIKVRLYDLSSILRLDHNVSRATQQEWEDILEAKLYCDVSTTSTEEEEEQGPTVLGILKPLCLSIVNSEHPQRNDVLLVVLRLWGLWPFVLEKESTPVDAVVDKLCLWALRKPKWNHSYHHWIVAIMKLAKGTWDKSDDVEVELMMETIAADSDCDDSMCCWIMTRVGVSDEDQQLTYSGLHYGLPFSTLRSVLRNQATDEQCVDVLKQILPHVTETETDPDPAPLLRRVLPPTNTVGHNALITAAMAVATIDRLSATDKRAVISCLLKPSKLIANLPSPLSQQTM